MPTPCTHPKEVTHVRTNLPCPSPSRVGGDLLMEAVLATAIHLSSKQIIDAAAVSPMPKFSACVVKRESGGTLADKTSGVRARNHEAGSSASGRWQFLDRAWRINGGLHYMVAERLRQFGMPAREARTIRVTLARTPIHLWPGALQDVGHAEVLERGGWFHWRNHDRCDRLAVR